MKKNKIIIIFSMLYLSGCIAVKAPENWLPSPDESTKELFGAWITVEIQNELNPVGGEFIAFQNDSLFILGEEDFYIFNKEDVKKITIDLYQRETSKVATWTLLGLLSTISHGLYLIFTAPIWGITSIAATIGASKSGLYEEDFPNVEWFESVRKFSRFPDGLPHNIKLNELKSKEIVDIKEK